MPKQKRDYEKLKKEFMASKTSEVKVFFEGKYGKGSWNGTISKNTKGWANEKKEVKARASVTSMKEAETKLAKQLEPSTEFLLGNINKAIELTSRKLEQMEEKDNINVKDLNTIWSMNRIQNGQPTTYVKEEQDVNQRVVLRSIHIVLGKKPIDNEESGENNA